MLNPPSNLPFLLAITLLAWGGRPASAGPPSAQQEPGKAPPNVAFDEGRQEVGVRKVTFRNGPVAVVGNLFVPPAFDAKAKYPAIVVVHPFGGVKEQTSGLYARRLAERGFVTLAYDACFQGESGGEPRLKEDPSVRVEDVRCAIDFLGGLTWVDETRVGALGICTGGAYAISATQTELRIKAVAGVSTFDLGSARREGVGGAISYAERMDRLREVGLQRSREARGEPVRLVPVVPDTPDQFTDKTPRLYREGHEYYRTPRAQHPNSPNRYLFSSLGLQMSFFPYAQIETISPRPVLFIVGSEADTAYMSKSGFEKAKEPKELFTVPGASHIDMYDKEPFVTRAVEKLSDYFKRNL